MDHFTAAFIYDVHEQALENNAIIGYGRENFRNRRRRCDPFLETEARFQKNFRLSKELTNNLIDIVRPFLSEKDIDLRTKVLAALNFFGTGSYQTPVGQNITIGLSQPSVSRCLEEVVTALNRPEIFNIWIKFPETQVEFNRKTREFYNMYDIPGVVGSIDCTHVAIVPPDETLFDERAYVNRKFYHSINTQLVCDAHLRILNVNALFPGSTHDSFIWNNSSLRPFMEQLHQTGYTQYHLIGDSGYALRPWCLTPVAEPEEGTPEFRFNEAFKKTRATIERCNGVIKGRFRCLIKDRTLHYTPPKATRIINACAVLHNMCIDANLDNSSPVDLNDDALGMFDPDGLPVNEPRGNHYLCLGRAKRNRIINNYFN